MKKKLLILILFLITIIVKSQTFVDNFINYSILPNAALNEVEITDYDFTGGTIVDIPSTVTYNTIIYTVSSISNNAFQGNASTNEQLTSVTIPNTIISIGDNAFGSNLLTTVIIPNSVTSLGNLTFLDNELTSVTLSNNLTSIGFGLFQSNDLTNIVLPNGITEIGFNAFINNQLINITIPSSVTTIGERAFRGNPLSNITTLGTTAASIITHSLNDSFSFMRNTIDLTIPAGSSSSYATNGWTGFNSITEYLEVGDTYLSNFISYEITSTANNTVKAIDYDIAGGSSITVPATIVNGLITYTVTTVGINAFFDKNLSSLIIEDGIITVETNSFRGNQLTNITIPSSIITVGNEAFSNNQLTSIIIPDTVTSLGANSFAFNELTSVTFPNTITTIPLGLFQHNLLTSVIIPDYIIDIEPGAFENNLLTTITIPGNVINIGSRAFKDNPLNSVTSLNSIPPTIFTQNSIFDTFNSDRSGIDLTIPSGTTGAYTTDFGALWTGFNTVNGNILSTSSNFELNNPIEIITNTNSIQIISPANINLKNYDIYTIIGAKVVSGNASQFSTTTLSKGIYILNLTFFEGIITKKIVIK